MNKRQFYEYILDHYNIGGTTSRLIKNILNFVDDMSLSTQEDAQNLLKELLLGAFGLEEHEIEQCYFGEEVDL